MGTLMLNGLNDALRLNRDLQRLFNALGGAEAGWSGPSVHTGEDQDNLYVEAILPGVDAEAIQVTVEQDILTIHGRREAPAIGEGKARWLQQERPFGGFTHRTRLPRPVDADKITAEYRDGILTVTLPKAAEAKPRQIAVQTNR